jgi:hypothetical protein
MNNTVVIGLIAFAAILAGAFVGVKVRERLPKHHLTDETKNLVSVSTAVVATVSALVLGLLISNANTSFTRLGGQVTALSAENLRLDHMLRRYGADAEPARNMLLQYAEQKAADLFPDNPAEVRLSKDRGSFANCCPAFWPSERTRFRHAWYASSVILPATGGNSMIEIETVTDEIETLAKADDSCRRVMTVPGIGPIISSAMVAAIGNGSAFSRGRD